MFKFGIVFKTLFVALLVIFANFGLLLLLPQIFIANNIPLIFVISSFSFLILLFILSRITKKNLGYYTQLLLELNKTNLEKEVESKGNDEFGEVVRSLETFRNALRERIRFAEESKDRAEAILFNVGEGVFAVNLHGEIIIFSHVAETMVGFSKDQVLGQRYDQILQFLDAKTKAPYGQFIDKVLLEGKTINLPSGTVMVAASGNTIPVAVNSSPIRNQKGLIIGGIVVFRDTSREKEIEEMRNDLISIASHQLRTPLSEIKGLIELLSDNVAGTLNQKQKEYISLLKVANERMINLVNDLLNISRIEQGRIQFKPKVVNLSTLAQEVFNTFKMSAFQKSQNLLFSQDNNKHLVWVDADKTKEIISNLIDNSLKYTFVGGTIQVRVMANEQGVWFLVKDSGVGIPKNRQKDLFNKFSRVENPLSKITSGTGLGLYTVKQLVEKQNGKIWFQSEEGRGSTFAFVFPPAKALT